MRIDKHRNAVRGKGLGDQRRADGDVVIAEAGEPQRARKCAEDLGAAVSGVRCIEKRERAVGDEISRQ